MKTCSKFKTNKLFLKELSECLRNRKILKIMFEIVNDRFLASQTKGKKNRIPNGCLFFPLTNQRNFVLAFASQLHFCILLPLRGVKYNGFLSTIFNL